MKDNFFNFLPTSSVLNQWTISTHWKILYWATEFWDFKNKFNNVVIEIHIMQFWSEIIHVISNETCIAHSINFEITQISPITIINLIQKWYITLWFTEVHPASPALPYPHPCLALTLNLCPHCVPLWYMWLGVGKTTMCKKVYEALQGKAIQAQGFYTQEVRNSQTGSRVGFDVVTLNGQRGPLARTKRYVRHMFVL